MRPQLDSRWIMTLAERQGGRVSRAQLLDGGLSSAGVQRRVRAGLLTAEARGVYRVGPDVPTRTGRLWRALLACGEDSALSHASSGVEHRVVAGWRGPVHVSVPSTSGRRAPSGVVLHRREAFEVVRLDGLPCTSLPLTFIDLAHHHPRLLPKALNEAQRLLLDVGDLRAFAAGKPGAQALLRALDAYDPREERTRQELERLALRMLVDRGAPVYEPNARVETALRDYEVDGLYAAQRVVVELQSEAHHSTPAERRADRIRANALVAAGHRLLHWDWHDVTRVPDATVAALLALLDAE